MFFFLFCKMPITSIVQHTTTPKTCCLTLKKKRKERKLTFYSSHLDMLAVPFLLLLDGNNRAANTSLEYLCHFNQFLLFLILEQLMKQKENL